MSVLPLEGLRVIDLTRARSGPTAVRQFADWGADVIMVESPSGGEDVASSRESSDFQNLHRNKRSIGLDLKSDDGYRAFLDLVRSADILIENFRPRVKYKLKIDYETLKKVNRRLIYASISGFGQTGPYVNRAGLDPVVQAMGGLMSITGEPGQGPMRAGIAISDTSAGLYCAIGTLMALYDRERRGKGAWIRTSLIAAQIAVLDFQAARWLTDGVVPPQEGNHHPTGVPAGMFKTADGNVVISPMGEAMFSNFARLAGREEWLLDPRFNSRQARYEHRELVRAAVAEAVQQKSTAEWIEGCERAGIPCGPVNRLDEVFADPQVQTLRMSLPVTSARGETLCLVGQPIEVEGQEFTIDKAAPEMGRDGEEILRSIGYDRERIEALRATGAMA